MQKACNMSHLIIITCVLSLPLSSTNQYTFRQKGNMRLSMWFLNRWMWKNFSLNENQTESSKGDQRVPAPQKLPYNFNFDDSFWGRATRWMRELSKSHYSRRICPPQCVRVIQTRKVRTGQNTSIYHRMNGINGYEFELLFKWVTKLYLWERRVLRIGFTSVKPKPGLLRETLKKLIIPIGPNIVFSRDLDKA